MIHLKIETKYGRKMEFDASEEDTRKIEDLKNSPHVFGLLSKDGWHGFLNKEDIVNVRRID